MSFADTFRRLELAVKRIVTPHNHSFVCDSHPLLCTHCSRLRFAMKHGRFPDIVTIRIKDGSLFQWTKVKYVVYSLEGLI